MSQHRDDYFARVRPLLGDGLRNHTIAIDRSDVCARVVELLAGCMLERVVGGSDALRKYLAWKSGFVPMRWLSEGEADFSISACMTTDAPFVEWHKQSVTMHLTDDWFVRQNLSYAVARDLRDILLGRLPPPEGNVYFGSSDWPFAQSRNAPSTPPPHAKLNGGHIMMIGCGSIGSEVARLLSPQRWTLVDSARVSVFNPHRQWFGCNEIGEQKVAALSRRLELPVCAYATDADAVFLAKLVERDRPDLVLLTTGTSKDAELAEVLWQHDIPHIAVYAYPQARYFEVNLVIPGKTPCLHCLRGNLFAGAESPPPMSDEVASFLYQHINEREREEHYQNLVAEPASPIETGRIADVVALCAAEMSQPNRWMQRILDEQTTCLLGGNIIEQHPGGELSYGISYPGQVIRLGLEDIIGVEEQKECAVCGRQLRTSIRLELPAIDSEDADRALL